MRHSSRAGIFLPWISVRDGRGVSFQSHPEAKGLQRDVSGIDGFTGDKIRIEASFAGADCAPLAARSCTRPMNVSALVPRGQGRGPPGFGCRWCETALRPSKTLWLRRASSIRRRAGNSSFCSVPGMLRLAASAQGEGAAAVDVTAVRSLFGVVFVAVVVELADLVPAVQHREARL